MSKPLPKALACPLATGAKEQPSALAIVSNTTEYTYLQCYSQARAWAKILRETYHLHPGDRVAIITQPTCELIGLLFACFYAGIVVCPLSTRLPIPALIKAYEDDQCKLLISETPIEGLSSLLIQDLPKAPLLSTIDPHQFYYQQSNIMRSSGSTGTPKRIVHTIHNHLYSALGSQENIPLKRNDRWLLSLPIYHISGWSILFRTLAGHATAVIPQPKISLNDAIKTHKITHISVVETQLRTLIQHPIPPHLNAILVGGGPLDEKLHQACIKNKLPLFITYGLTEMSSQVATSTATSSLETRHLNIKSLPYRECRRSTDGELLVKGPVLFEGYLTSNHLIELKLDQDHWFHTGDFSKISDMEGLMDVYRKDTLFISGGENIYPEEIERCLLRHARVTKVLVFPRKDASYGHIPVAFIHTSESLTIDELTTHLHLSLPKFKHPKTYYQWPTRLDSGIKINRNGIENIDKHLYDLAPIGT